ncbi:MAG: NAD(P)/FAD-dependent oxidoreductase [Bacteroidota bacterium]
MNHPTKFTHRQPSNDAFISLAIEETNAVADACIIGGGLAGLSLSILLAKQGWKVILFEKHTYPFHKVCGEYISLESKPFIERLGFDIPEYKYPHITDLKVSAASGVEVNRRLDIGGFGISRFTLDYELSLIAKNCGVTILHERVEDVNYIDNKYHVKSNKGQYTSTICTGSFGKRSNLDVKWQRSFVKSAQKGLNNYLGIKYHIRHDHPKETIALHNFKNGYCGISAIEDDKYCLCYLTSANNLASNGNDIAMMERNILHQNKNLKKIFTEATFLYPEPLVISQVSFVNKTQYERNMPLCGDAAGLITPLCGNGMSMALKAASLLAPLLDQYLNGSIKLEQLNGTYSKQWHATFNRRLQVGRMVQNLFGNNQMTSLFLQTCRTIPAITDTLIRYSHGDTY